MQQASCFALARHYPFRLSMDPGPVEHSANIKNNLRPFIPFYRMRRRDRGPHFHYAQMHP